MTKAIIFGSSDGNSGYQREHKAIDAILICLLMAVLAGVFYLLIGIEVVRVPVLSPEEAPPVMAFIAGGCYILGGLLIVLRRRWLWIIGLVMNTMVMVIFFLIYSQKPEIILSFPGLATKIPEILLEFGLIYIITSFRIKSQLVHHLL